jgi:hypothetical protein
MGLPAWATSSRPARAIFRATDGGPGSCGKKTARDSSPNYYAAEGVDAATAVRALAQQHAVDMPI